MNKNKPPLITPELARFLREFDVHLEAAEDYPTLIIGHSGVGKSLFLDEYKKKERESSGKDPLYIDCSMFIGTDPNIAKSSLFGHEKGAYTGADAKKKGLIEVAHNNAQSLILDEVGELPQEVQAMLLVYLDSGKFRPVGGVEEKECQTKIIAATNRESQLREELRYRFFKFYIPGIHRRREDVLRFFAYFFPEIFRRLTLEETLSLWSYHWPGGIRELRQVGMMLKCAHKVADGAQELMFRDNLEDNIHAGLWALIDLDTHSTNFNSYHLVEFEDRLKKKGVDVIRLYEIVFKNIFTPGDPIRKIELDEFDLIISDETRVFREQILFFYPNKNVWQNNKGVPKMNKKYEEKISIVNRTFMGFYLALSIDYEKNTDLAQLENWEYKPRYGNCAGLFVNVELSEDLDLLTENIAKCFQKKGPNTPNLSNLTHEEVERLYYSQLLKKFKNNKSHAAKAAGLVLSTFNSRLKKHGLS